MPDIAKRNELWDELDCPDAGTRRGREIESVNRWR
jgi:hypothetical protein